MGGKPRGPKRREAMATESTLDRYFEDQAGSLLVHRWDRARFALAELADEIKLQRAALGPRKNVSAPRVVAAEQFLAGVLSDAATGAIDREYELVTGGQERALVAKAHAVLASGNTDDAMVARAAVAIDYQPPPHVVRAVRSVADEGHGRWKTAQRLVAAKLGLSLRTVQARTKKVGALARLGQRADASPGE